MKWRVPESSLTGSTGGSWPAAPRLRKPGRPRWQLRRQFTGSLPVMVTITLLK